MKKKKPSLPPPYTAETKDQRLAGTWEVLVPVEGRNKPHRVPHSFPSQQQAEAWLHSAEGKETVAEILENADG
ncbi:MAG TPA: hypothetical protein VGG10_12800 [Rhizomicrobium sp.]|jgi:hypothetical protein